MKRLQGLRQKIDELDSDIAKTFQLHRDMSANDDVELVKQELSRLSEKKKAHALKAMELESFIESQPKPKEMAVALSGADPGVGPVVAPI